MTDTTSLMHNVIFLAWEQLHVPQPSRAAKQSVRAYVRMAVDAFDSLGVTAVTEGAVTVSKSDILDKYEAVRDEWKEAERGDGRS